MLIVKMEVESNGAHAGQQINANIPSPEGYVVIPQHLEAATLPLLPWVKLTVEDGIVIAVEDDVESRNAQPNQPEPTQPVDPLSDVKLAVAELAELQANQDLENKVAIAELAEKMLGGAM